MMEIDNRFATGFYDDAEEQVLAKLMLDFGKAEERAEREGWIKCILTFSKFQFACM